MVKKLKIEYSLREVGEMLGVSPSTMLRRVHAGEVRAHRVGKHWRVSLDALRDNANCWESLLLKKRLEEP